MKQEIREKPQGDEAEASGKLQCDKHEIRENCVSVEQKTSIMPCMDGRNSETILGYARENVRNRENNVLVIVEM